MTQQRDAQSAATLAAVQRMEAGLANRETDMTPYFHEDFTWRGNYGCGTKTGLDAFRAHWQRPFRAAFSERVYRTERFLADGEWAACFGHIDARHTGEFMGIAPTGKPVKIPYIDFWRVVDGRIADNPVNVDFPFVLAQLGHDVFDGKGWEVFDRGEAVPPSVPEEPPANMPAPQANPRTPLEIVRAMEAALQRADVDVSDYFHDDFPWIANYGCGTKRGLQEFERNWYAPFRACFAERNFKTQLFMEDGDWAACFGWCEATHAGELMGIPASGRRIRIPYIDFWRIADGKIAENRVSVDYPSVLHQLGHDVFGGHGWEGYDRGEFTPPNDPDL